MDTLAAPPNGAGPKLLFAAPGLISLVAALLTPETVANPGRSQEKRTPGRTAMHSGTTA